MIQVNVFTGWKRTRRLGEQAYGCLGGRMGVGGIVREFEVDMYTLLYLKWITNNDILCTGNSAQCYVLARMGVEFGEEWINICV